MPDLVCTGATLECSFGTTDATFSAAGVRTSAGTPAGVVTDFAPDNVPSFGLCTSPDNPEVKAFKTPQPCQPVLEAWSPGSARVTIGRIPALDDSSQCNCLWQGVVTVTDAGQKAASAQ